MTEPNQLSPEEATQKLMDVIGEFIGWRPAKDGAISAAVKEYASHVSAADKARIAELEQENEGLRQQIVARKAQQCCCDASFDRDALWSLVEAAGFEERKDSDDPNVTYLVNARAEAAEARVKELEERLALLEGK